MSPERGIDLHRLILISMLSSFECDLNVCILIAYLCAIGARSALIYHMYVLQKPNFGGCHGNQQFIIFRTYFNSSFKNLDLKNFLNFIIHL